MAKPYSTDLRERVAAAIASGDSCRAIAEQFEIAPSTVVKWSKRVRETGSSAPAKFGGYRTCTLEPHRAFVLAQLEEVPHLTLHKLKDMNIVRVSDKKRLRFRVTKYDFSDTTVIVYWTDADGSASQTTYGKFGSDGRTMIQIKTTPERPYRRC